MNDRPAKLPETGSDAGDFRCPHCDSVVPDNASQCIMCGAEISADERRKEAASTSSEAEPHKKEELPAGTTDFQEPVPDVFESVMHERKSRSLLWMTIVIALLTLIASVMLLRDQDAELTLAMVPTATPLPPTLTYTPTWTPFATETIRPTETQASTSTPAPTNTPQPPRYHSVAGGETLFGLSLFYRISADSIAGGNDIPMNSPIQVGQQLLIPWPTATPPLESLVLEIKGETFVADVTDCEIVTIEEGDSTYGLSAEKGVPAEAIMAVNRLTEESIQLLHPGDTLCVPKVIHGDTLPATPGSAPTITSTSFPRGPNLLYPTHDAVLDPGDDPIALQWGAVKDLDENEWYMVELTDLDLLDAIPLRAFTRDNAYRLSSTWRPTDPELHQMRWRISIVLVTGQRDDGEFIYRYGGQSSEDAFFSWLGAVPTATPTLTPVPTETPTP